MSRTAKLVALAAVAAGVGLAAVVAVLPGAWEEVKRVARVAWDGDMAAVAAKRRRQALLAVIDKLQQDADQTMVDLSDFLAQVDEEAAEWPAERLAPKVNGLESRMERVLHSLDEIRGDEEVVARRKALVYKLDKVGLAAIDGLRARFRLPQSRF